MSRQSTDRPSQQRLNICLAHDLFKDIRSRMDSNLKLASATICVWGSHGAMKTSNRLGVMDELLKPQSQHQTHSCDSLEYIRL